MTTRRPWQLHSSSKRAAERWVQAVLQIYHHYGSARRFLVVLILPGKIGHGKVTKIEIANPVIFGDWSADLLHDSLNNAWRHNYAPLVVEQDVELSIALVRASDLTH